MNTLMKDKGKTPTSIGSLALLTILASLLLSGCREEIVSPPVVRSVRSIVIERHEVGDPVVLTGHIRARDEVSLAFRISGKVIERSVDVGDTVKAGQLVARLDDEMEQNALRAAWADLTAAQAVLEQSAARERRFHELLREGASTQDEYEGTLRQQKTANAQVHAAEARLKSASDQLGYTELKSEADGVITEKGAEPGEVVRVGQMILTLAREEGRDAVFGMPAQVIREGLSLNQEVEVWLADNPDIKAIGHIREISPQADPVTRNHQVKVGLVDPPVGMFLGATAVGHLELRTAPVIEIPSSALMMLEDKPAVWVIDSKAQRVSLREIKIERYTPDSVIATDGLVPGERIVTAGVQELHEGQEIKLLGDPS
ncbi:MAG: Multidrug resistance protein MdtA [bacterium]|nr:Multidrug resistance protein MdtA [bacterium]